MPLPARKRPPSRRGSAKTKKAISAETTRESPVEEGPAAELKSKPRPKSTKHRARSAPKRQRPLRLRADTPLHKAAREMAANAVALVTIGWHRVETEDGPEAPHALRVALRRLRVVLHIFRDHIEDTPDAGLRASLAALGRQVGSLRDLDVLAHDIVGPVATGSDVAGGTALMALLEADRKQAISDVRQFLGSAESRALLDNLTTLATRLATAVADSSDKRTLNKTAHRDIRKRWRKFAKQAATIDKLDEASLHEVRKSLKKLRYAFGYFTPCFGGNAAHHFDARLRRLQSTFGYLNDVACAKQLEARLSSDAAQPDINCAIGFILGAHTERAKSARDKLVEQYQKLADSKLARELGD